MSNHTSSFLAQLIMAIILQVLLPLVSFCLIFFKLNKVTSIKDFSDQNKQHILTA